MISVYCYKSQVPLLLTYQISILTYPSLLQPLLIIVGSPNWLQGPRLASVDYKTLWQQQIMMASDRKWQHILWTKYSGSGEPSKIWLRCFHCSLKSIYLPRTAKDESTLYTPKKARLCFMFVRVVIEGRMETQSARENEELCFPECVINHGLTRTTPHETSISLKQSASNFFPHIPNPPHLHHSLINHALLHIVNPSSISPSPSPCKPPPPTPKVGISLPSVVIENTAYVVPKKTSCKPKRVSLLPHLPPFIRLPDLGPVLVISNKPYQRSKPSRTATPYRRTSISQTARAPAAGYTPRSCAPTAAASMKRRGRSWLGFGGGGNMKRWVFWGSAVFSPYLYLFPFRFSSPPCK